MAGCACVILVLAGCDGDANEGAASDVTEAEASSTTRGPAPLMPDCAGGGMVSVADAPWSGAASQAEGVRVTLTALGMDELATRVPDRLPTSGTDGFVSLSEMQVAYLEGARALGVFGTTGGAVCQSLQERFTQR